LPLAAHPHFVSPLSWHTDLAEACAEAARTGRMILVVHGAATCAGTRGFVERTMAKEEIVGLLRQRFVVLASDAERPADVLAGVLARAPRLAPTPVCLYLSSGGELSFSTAGGRPPAVLVNDLLQASSGRPAVR
jgi:hypothetical protein